MKYTCQLCNKQHENIKDLRVCCSGNDKLCYESRRLAFATKLNLSAAIDKSTLKKFGVELCACQEKGPFHLNTKMDSTEPRYIVVWHASGYGDREHVFVGERALSQALEALEHSRARNRLVSVRVKNVFVP